MLKKGSIVRHEIFGLGVVTEDECDGRVSVDFDGRTKQLVMKFAPMVRVSSEDERERRKSTFRQEMEGDDDKGHAHGSHWDPFFADPKDVLGQVQNVVESQIIDAFSASYLPSRESVDAGIEWPDKAFYFSWPSSTLGLRAIIQVDGDGTSELKSMFPNVGGGLPYPITLNEAVVWPGGVEAQIKAGLGGALVVFFDCGYGENRNRYREGAVLDFILSAVAYDCGPVEEEIIEIPFRPKFWGAGEPPKELSLKGASMLVPETEWDRDDYSFRGPVRQVEKVEMLGQEAWLTTATVVRTSEIPWSQAAGSGEDFDLPILITAKAWRHDSPPEPGQDIAGTLWMQGFLQP